MNVFEILSPAAANSTISLSGGNRTTSGWSPWNTVATSLAIVSLSGLLSWQSFAQTNSKLPPESKPDQAQTDEPQKEDQDHPKFSDELKVKLTRQDARGPRWYFIDLERGESKTPPFPVNIDATRLPYFVNKPSERELNDWLVREGVDLIVRSEIYRPTRDGNIEKNDIQVRSVRTLLQDLPYSLQQNADKSWSWTTTPHEVVKVFERKDDAVHVSGFVPNSFAGDIRPDSPILQPFRTAQNVVGLFLLEQPSSTEDELTLRIVHVKDSNSPMADVSFGTDDLVSGKLGANSTTAEKGPEAPFTATFPNHVRVEFVGVTQGAGDTKAAERWWKPDGTPLGFAPEYRGGSGVEGDEATRPYVRTVIHVHGIKDESAVTVTSAIQSADSNVDASGGRYVAHYGYSDAPDATRSFEVGVATEPLSLKRWLDPNGNRQGSQGENPLLRNALDPIAEDITIEKIGPETWGRKVAGIGPMIDPVGPGDEQGGRKAGTTQVTIRVPLKWRQVDLRLFAVDKTGKSHSVDMTVQLEPNEANANYTRLAKILPISFDEVDHFEYQFRLYRHWVIFENVSQRKGEIAKVNVVPETIPTVEVKQGSASKKSNRVVDQQGKPIPGAKVDCLPSMKYSWQKPPPSLGSTVSDSEGWFDYPENLPFKERFYVYVTADGFLERVFQANNGEAYILENGSRRLDTLALRRPVTVSGKIIGVDGKPLANAEIAVDYMYDNGWSQINGNRVKSDALGRFIAKGLEPANLFVRYESPYKTNEERMPIGTHPGKLCIVAFTASDGQEKDDVVLDLTKCNCVVEGVIVDHENKGVANRWIQATIASAKGRLDESITTKSDADGRFRFEGLTADEFSIGTYTSVNSESVKLSPDKPVQVRLTTYFQGKDPTEKDPNPPIYGEPSASGIVGGVRLKGGEKFRLGDVITAEIFVKNNSDQLKMVAYSFSEQANLRVFEGEESIAELNHRHFTGASVTVHYRLEPKQEAVVGSFKIGLYDPDDQQNGLPTATFQLPCRAGQSLTMRCEMSANVFGRNQDNDGASQDRPASTGTLPLVVLQKSTNDPDSVNALGKRPLAPTIVLPDFVNVMAVRFDADSRTITSVATKGDVTIRTWDIAEKKLVREIKLDTEVDSAPIFEIQFLNGGLGLSRNAKQLVACTNGKVRVWNTEDGKLIQTLPSPIRDGRSVEPRGLASTPNFDIIAAAIGNGFSTSNECEIAVWQGEKYGRIKRLSHSAAEQITSLALSADGSRLASGSQSASTCVFDLATGKLLYTLPNSNADLKHPDPKVTETGANQVLCLAFSPDGKKLAIGDLLGVKIVDAATGELIHAMGSPFRFGRSGFVFSSDSKLLARTATDKTVPIWSVETGKLIVELPTEAHDAAFSNDGKWFAAGFTDDKQGLALWNLEALGV